MSAQTSISLKRKEYNQSGPHLGGITARCFLRKLKQIRRKGLEPYTLTIRVYVIDFMRVDLRHPLILRTGIWRRGPLNASPLL